MVIHIARHVLPIASPPLFDAAVAVEDGVVRGLGRRKEVLKAAGTGAEIRGSIRCLEDYIRDERKVTLDALEKLTTEIVKLGAKLDDTDNIIKRGR